jgi:hypothetical protein
VTLSDLNAKQLKMIQDRFVCVTFNTHRPSAGYSFMDKVDGGVPRNNFFVVAANGKVLADGMYAELTMEEGWKKWLKLPEKERKPGAVTIEETIKPDEADLASPEGGVILKVWTRALKRDEKGPPAHITKADLRDTAKYPKWTGGRGNIVYTMPTVDHVWFKEAEWKALLPAKPTEGAEFPLPEAIQQRLARFHLTDGTRGLVADQWRPEDVRSCQLTLKVTEVSEKAIKLTLQGTVLLADNAEVEKAETGFDARLDGFIEYDSQKKRLTRFDMVAYGEFWGEQTICSQEGNAKCRPGRAPLGISFELVSGEQPKDRIPPHFSNRKEYFGR